MAKSHRNGDDEYFRFALYFAGARKLPGRAGPHKKSGALPVSRICHTTFGAVPVLAGSQPGVLAQLVQSATLTRWRSLVRAQYASRKPSLQCAVRVFYFTVSQFYCTTSRFALGPL